jgi:hypothetical protein
MDPANSDRDMPRAMTQAMIDYYGDSVRKLQRANPAPKKSAATRV